MIAGNLFVGTQLLPNTGCKPTWPDPDALEWPGTKRLTQDAFSAAQFMIDPTGMEDPFAFWRVPEDLRTGKPLGDVASFGEFSDWTSELLVQYGEIVPGGSGSQTMTGWPLGLTIQFDAFSFNLPTVNSATFFQFLIINESEKVWGVPVDYDSLYYSLQRAPGQGQFQNFTVDLSRGIFATRNCRPTDSGIDTPYGGAPVDCTSTSNVGFSAGSHSLMFLKSPIGDLRNKLLSDPMSVFFNPSHPSADDTITFNHSHGCGFITCTSLVQDFSERAAFGITSSTEQNVLDGRARTDFENTNYFNIFNNEDWPARGDFNRFIPGDIGSPWDYNEDGVEDTIYIDSCSLNGCTPLWEDTVPGGLYNRVGQTAPIGMGPFALAAGDTTGLVIAYVGEKDSASVESTMQAVFEFYTTFYFGPESAPAPVLALEGVGVTGGNADSAEVRLSWNDAARNFVDPFLLKLADDVETAAPGTQLGKIRDLNPGIVDSLRNTANDPLAQLHVFRSCDGGTTFTDDSNCFGDRVLVDDSKFSGLSWLPWRTLEPDVNSTVDADATPGLSTLYSLVTETKGAVFDILQDQGGALPLDTLGVPFCDPSRCIAGPFVFAPPLLSPLARTPDADGVASVYVPMSLQAGMVGATFSIESDLGQALVPVGVSLTQGVRNGEYDAVFADTLFVTVVVRSRDLGGGRADTLSVENTVVTSGAAPVTYVGSTVRSPITLRGEEFISTISTLDPADTTVTITTTDSRVVGDGTPVAMAIVETTGGAGDPLMATGVLEEGKTTPGGFLDHEDYPGYFIDVEADEGGEFDRQIFFNPAGDSIPTEVIAGQSIQWLDGEANDLTSVQSFSEYLITWDDKPYGADEEFVLQQGLQDVFTNSVAARAVAGTTLFDDSTLADIRAAGVSADSGLYALDLPFTIRNVTENADVSLAVIQHFEDVLLGQATDTIRVDVPAGKWTPGDALVLLEPDASGALVPTWEAVIGCDPSTPLRITCDATTTSQYAAVVGNGVTQFVIYFRPLSAETEFTLTVNEPQMDVAAMARGLENIKVVPNPYIVFSEYEQTASARIIKFTGLPDEGRVRIYTVSGQFVQEITWTPDDLFGSAGDLIWNMRSRENTEIAYGLYIWVVNSPAGVARGKFVVIR